MPPPDTHPDFPLASLLDPIPAPVTHLDAHSLEWKPFLTLLATYSASRPGRTWIEALTPSTDPAWIERQHQLIVELRSLLNSAVSIPLGGLFDPTQLAAKSQIPSAAMEPEELQAIGRLANDIGAWQAIMRNPPASAANVIFGLQDASSALTVDLRPLAESIDRKLLPDGTLADDASPELSRIRNDQQRQQRVIEESLRSALRKLSTDGHTQDDLITIRGDRFVIPVKSEQKRRVSGVVHGASSSGQTVYVEPLETIEQNNELVRLLEEEQAEIHRIFVALTRLVGGYAEQLVAGARVLALVDSLQARARFSMDYDCVRPVFSVDPATAVFRLESARHPLLEKRLRASGGSIVPLTLQLESSARQLIISGPNTGGKTVTLKTTALLAIMAQAGIPVPATAATQPVFTAFLADIGDAQSIEQALSTFSAHITNIDRLSRLATPSALVLLDELGSATDPDEGSALAVAIAAYFLGSGAWSLISTHHTSLKVYAANTRGVVNAAAGVDELTLAPNYQLRLGVPGASAGIQTAERLGLNLDIIRAAHDRLGTQQVDIARFLQSLHTQLVELEAERKAARAEQYSLNQERARLAREGDVELKKRTRELELKLGSLLKDFEFQMRQAVAAIDDRTAQLKLSKESERRIQRLRRDFEEQFNSTVVAHKSGADVGDPNAQPHVVRNIAIGDQVRIKSMNKIGTVAREVEKDLYEISLGALKMRIKRDDIAEVVNPNKADQKQTPLSAVARQKGVRVTVTSSGSEDMKSEINLIGHTVDEATHELEKYLDQAFLAGLPTVRVIHGTGMGILRRALREFLRTHPHVASIQEPTHQEGGAGATTVTLRQ
ncbi:endonuclease MutS2 [Acidicapsa ligni]|uniref:endonuclease MutS2 n=1 Tax=Acidicapsa ligni TaxID=542300 RepID=UPI0021DFDC30|nr:Smr/MutS family protein [Acidicapsa ligni]